MRKFLIVLALCILPVIGKAQADSVTLFNHFSNVLVRELCVKAHVTLNNRIIIDSLFPQTFVSECKGYNGAIALVHDSTVPENNIYYLNDVILRDRLDFLLMCGMNRATGPIFCSQRP